MDLQYAWVTSSGRPFGETVSPLRAAASRLRGHCERVSHLDQADRRSRYEPALRLVVRLGKCPPEVAGRAQKLFDHVHLGPLPVRLLAGVERETKRTERVGLPC